jgi:predicted NBD/HSP70 family sugar kinase
MEKIDLNNMRAASSETAHDINRRIGVSLPGRIDPESRELRFAPNPGWRKVHLKKSLTRPTGLEVDMENAANACVRWLRAWFLLPLSLSER